MISISYIVIFFPLPLDQVQSSDFPLDPFFLDQIWSRYFFFVPLPEDIPKETYTHRKRVLRCVAVCCNFSLDLFSLYQIWSISLDQIWSSYFCFFFHSACSKIAWYIPTGVLRCVAVCCSVLQCVAVCCSVLQQDGPIHVYRAAKMHRIPYLYGSFSAKEPYN